MHQSRCFYSPVTPEAVLIEYEIDGATCKTHHGECGNSGSVDIVYIDKETDTIYVWEVKIAHRPDEADHDVKWYVKKLKETGDFKNVKPGFALTSLVFAAVPGTKESVVAWNGPTKGSILYRAFRWREPKPPPPKEVPVPVEAPKPVEVPKPVVDPWVVGAITAGVVIVAGACILASVGVCGVAVGAGVAAGAAAA